MHSQLTLLCDEDDYGRFVAADDAVVKFGRLIDFQKWLDSNSRVDRSRSGQGTFMKLL